MTDECTRPGRVWPLRVIAACLHSPDGGPALALSYIHPMRARLLPGGECLLVEAPAVNSHRAAVVLRVVVCRDGVFECHQDGTLHPADVVRVVTHCLAVVRHQLVDGGLFQLAVAPTSEGDASLLP